MLAKTNKEKKKLRYGEIGKIILRAIATVGVVSVILSSPLSINALVKAHGKYQRKFKLKNYITSTIKKLHHRDLIKISNGNITLTKKGEVELEKYKLEENFLKKRNKKWDGKWRVVIFDIKERYRQIRDGLRIELDHFGFIKLQNSVWITPYPCNDIIALLKTDMMIARDLLYLVVEKIESDNDLRKAFNLI